MADDPCTCLHCQLRALLPGGSAPTEAERIEAIAAMVPLLADRLATSDIGTMLAVFQKIADLHASLSAATRHEHQRAGLATMEVAGHG